jgi:Omp85 superfamily domain
MKMLCLVAAALVASMPGFAGGEPAALPAATNINSRYVIESVSVSGVKNRLLSRPLRAELNQEVGAKLDHPTLEQIAGRIKKELHVSDVDIKITRGTTPDHVIVNFEIAPDREQRFDLNVAKFLYDSKQGWSGEGGVTTHLGGNSFSFALVSDADILPERFSGLRARFERKRLGTDRLSLRFDFDSFHDQWNAATLIEAPPGTIYHSHQIFLPEMTLLLAQPLELDFGFRFARYRLSTPAANTESSNAVVSTLRYHQRWGSAVDANGQEIEASYSLEAATQVLESDPTYTRQDVHARYRLRHNRSQVELRFLAGRILGLAPLFDRYVLGNASTLRGWNMFDLDPLGGSRVVHGSVDYAYRFFQFFYDTGAVWDHPTDRQRRQSAGAGFKKENFQLAVAFPLRAGRIDPVFFAGMNF